MARSSLGRMALAALLAATMVVSLNVPISAWAVDSDAEQTVAAGEAGGGSEEAITLADNGESSISLASSRSVSDLITFKGGSLRMDAGDPATETYLRFGYTFRIPNGATLDEISWEYYVDPSDKHNAKADNNLLLEDGTCMSNLVISNVSQANYDTTVYVKAYISYLTADGTNVTVMESGYNERSVKQVAESILDHPMANGDAKSYANEIINACSKSQE